ncbi:MAG: BON domain-containing protein [Bordetella sp.]|uniref:BON domain-containing protein n=1 Tax=Bordetella sp. TaxID=28081 RepID=UPI003F7B8261
MTFTPRMALRAALLAAALTGTASSLTGCIPLMLGGAAVGASVFTDRRSSGTQLDDQTMAFKAQFQIAKQLGDAARVNAVAYEGNVLLTGDVPTQAAKDQATTIAQGIEKVKSVINQLDVGPAEPFEGRSNDAWLSSKVRTSLLSTKDVPSGAIVTTVNRGVVYMMGKVTQEEGDIAAKTAASVGGIVKVVKMFTYISRDEAIRLSGAATTSTPSNGSGGSAPTSGPAPIENGSDTMQAMPIK